MPAEESGAEESGLRSGSCFAAAFAGDAAAAAAALLAAASAARPAVVVGLGFRFGEVMVLLAFALLSAGAREEEDLFVLVESSLGVSDAARAAAVIGLAPI